MGTSTWIIASVFLLTLTQARAQYVNTTCEEFEKNARFDPFEIVDSKWKIIYFWSPTVEPRPVIFSLLARKRLDRFKEVVNALEPELRPEWDKAAFMMEPKPGVQVVMLYLGTAGAFRGIVKFEQRYKDRPIPPPLIKLADLRFKLVDRHMAMMCCEDMTAFVLSRTKEVPSSEEECLQIASKFGLKGVSGRSHFYLKSLTRTEL
ncbi:uncharacterized protein LOC116779841 [Danaus plexippus]|uniref:uncharacterized protein LOC116779841 n=1 Tax=Danaus plexippus TaxID=13037 RepID=UPI002AB1C6F3|nr:uncharacterized protein LOC116779841 [Danaus plexippus]